MVPFGDCPLDDENVGEHVFLDMLYTAKRYMHIMTPYLIIGYELVQAMNYAAKRGYRFGPGTHRYFQLQK